MAGAATIEADVAIVGYGPVGAILANLLADCGLSVAVFEREAEIFALPRAVHFDDEAMRVFQALGVADRIARSTRISPGMHFVDAEGRLILDWSRPLDIGPQGWNVSFRFHQPDLERALRDIAAAKPNVDVRLRADVYAIRQDADGVDVQFETLSTGALHGCRAKYVVGCDGGRSLTRRLIGSSLEDLGFHERWLVVDALLKRDVPSLGDYSVQFCDPARPATYVRGVDQRRRWEIALRADEDPAVMTEPSHVWRLLERWITPEDADLERAACYMFHSAIAERWRDGRLLVAGDAAHQTPPFLGQGLCAGVRDAANLAWKLARVIRRGAPDGLLDSYQSERQPHVREYIELAVRLGGLINTRAAEAAVPGGLARTEPASMSTLKPKLGPGLRAGCDILVGAIAPQPILAEGARFDDHVGYRFCAVFAPELAAALTPALRGGLGDRDVLVDEARAPMHRQWLEANGVGAVLVRPDRYVMGAARDIGDVEAWLRAI